MAALDFPPSPSVGQKYPVTPIAGTPVYTWDGEKWTTYGLSIAGMYVAKTGDVMSGHLQLPTGPAAANAVRKDYVDNAIAAASPPATTVAEYLANSQPAKYLTSGATWGAASVVLLGASTSYTLNLSAGIDFLLQPTANFTLAAPTGLKNGQKGLILIAQPAGGGKLITIDAAWKFSSGVKPILSPTQFAIDIISYYVLDATPSIFCAFSPDFK